MSTWRTKISVNTGTEWLADDLIIVTEVRHTPRSRTDVVAIDTMNSLIESEFPLQETQRLHYDLLQTLMDRNLAYIIEDKVVQNVRYLDKLIDELAKGKAMDKILRK